MRLRELQQKDAELMYEWMHDDNVVKDMQTDFKSKTMDDCRKFIEYAAISTSDVHFAIVDDEDLYLGTVSLKHIYENTAEFAISIRSSAMGKGVSGYGMREIIHYGLEDMGLRYIYWCVNPENIRAVRFYDKNNYKRLNVNDDCDIKHILEEIQSYEKKQIENYMWYKVEN